MPPNSGRDRFHRAHDLVRIFRVQTDRKRIDAGEFFEQHRLAFHHRHGGGWANVAEAEHRGSVGDDGDGVFLDRQRENFFRIFVNRFADARDAGRVGHREIGASLQRHFRDDFDLAAEVHQESRIGDLNQFDAVDVFDGFDDLFAVFARN